jgi:preprotein translocase subunit SecE
VNNWIQILIWVVAVGVVFGFLWWQGQIQRLAVYVRETREELKKCSWPTWEELKGSTALIVVMITLLGLSIVGIDAVLYKCSFNPLALAIVAVAGYGIMNFVLLKRQ